MAIIKCKMCGGDLNLIAGASTAECEYCGSLQTVPAADDDKKLTLFARANRLRAACEFDKAAGVYESIVADFSQEAEAYWGLILCKYGIEYVDDPATGKKIPTCHRTSFESVMDEANYEQTLENADPAARKVYREEAKQIEELRKGIIEVSAKEEPYDVFICYKETDENGERTLDSVLAQDIYDALCQKNYRVFFSRITLENKLGQEYEPYIFAALNSAKVMLAVGTDYEYYNAVWVKNEWSRYLKLMEKQKDKHLIPCFKGIDAYDMPKEFNKLQAQDMGKVGAMQDLLRGIGKLVETGTVTATQTVGTTTVIVDTMLKRAADAIAVRDWEKAVRCYSNVLDYDENNEQAYIGQLLINRRAASLDELEAQNRSIADDPNYQYLSKNGSKSTFSRLYALEMKIAGKIRMEAAQEAARKKAKKALCIKAICGATAAVILLVVGLYLAQNVFIPGSAYSKAQKLVEQGQYDQAAAEFAALGDFKDSRQQIHETYMKKADHYAAEGDYLAALDVLTSSEVEALGNGVDHVRQVEFTYLMAVQAYTQGDYPTAIERFSEVHGYQDADNYLANSRHTLAEQAYQKGDYDTAIEQFKALGDNKGGFQRAQEITWEVAEASYAAGQFDAAIAYYKDLGEYNGGAQRAWEIAYEVAETHYSSGDLAQAIAYFTQAEGYEDAADRVLKTTYEAGKQCMNEKQYLQAVEYFSSITEYSDAEKQMLKAKFQYCEATQEAPTDTSREYIRELKKMDYRGAAKVYDVIFAWTADMRVKVSLRIGTQTGVSFYAKLSGGDGTSTKVKFVVKVQGETLDYCDDKLYAAGEEASCQLSNALQDITELTYTVYVYDGNGNQIGYFKGVPEPF